MRRELGLRAGETMILHISNLRPVKRIDVLLAAAAKIRPRHSFKLVILAGTRVRTFPAPRCGGWDSADAWSCASA